MAVVTKTKWRIAGEEIGSCNCAWGCPCQFNANPTHDNCEAVVALDVWRGHHGDVRLDGVRFARLYWWPGSIHEGNGVRQTVIDERATREQRDAIDAMDSGTQGGAYWEVFSAVCPNRLPPLTAPIRVEIDREHRRGIIVIPGIAESRVEPIKNPVTGDEHRARIDLPNGFEFKQAEVGNSVAWSVTGTGRLSFKHQDTYAQLAAFDWSN